MKTLDKVKDMTAERMRKLREKAGMNQRELADAIGYSQASVCRMETGEQEVSARAAKLIAIVTHVVPTFAARTA